MISPSVDAVFHWVKRIDAMDHADDVYEVLSKPPPSNAQITPHHHHVWWSLRRLWPPFTERCPDRAYLAFRAAVERRESPLDWLCTTFQAEYRDEWGSWPLTVEDFVAMLPRIEGLTETDAGMVSEWLHRNRHKRDMASWLRASLPSLGIQPRSKRGLTRVGLRPKATD